MSVQEMDFEFMCFQMDNGWNRIGENKKVKNECLKKEKFIFCFGGWRKKRKKCFEIENMFM